MAGTNGDFACKAPVYVRRGCWRRCAQRRLQLFKSEIRFSLAWAKVNARDIHARGNINQPLNRDRGQREGDVGAEPFNLLGEVEQVDILAGSAVCDVLALPCETGGTRIPLVLIENTTCGKEVFRQGLLQRDRA